MFRNKFYGAHDIGLVT